MTMEGTRMRETPGEVIFEGIKRFGGGFSPAAKFRWKAPWGEAQTFVLTAQSVQNRINNVRARGGDVSEEELALAALAQ